MDINQPLDHGTVDNLRLDSQSLEYLQESLSNLKSHYKFMGIFLLAMIGFYALGILFALIGGAAAAFM